MAKAAKVKLSERAVLARINRKLAPEYKRVKKCRPNGHGFDSLGVYYVVDVYRNAIEDTHVDLTKYGRELGVVAGYEEVE